MAVTIGSTAASACSGTSGKLVLTLYGALIVFVLVALVPVALLVRIPLRRVLERASRSRG